MQPSPGGWVGSLFSSVIYIFCFQETHQVRGIVFTVTHSSECDAFVSTGPLGPSFTSISKSLSLNPFPIHQWFWTDLWPMSLSSWAAFLCILSLLQPDTPEWDRWCFQRLFMSYRPTDPDLMQVPWNLVSQGRVHGGALYSSWSMGPLPLPVPTSTLQNAFGFNPPFTDQFVVFWPKEILSCFQEYSIFKKYLSLYLDLKLSCGKHEVTRPK